MVRGPRKRDTLYGVSTGFDVWLIAFESHVPDPIEALRGSFGMDLQAARELEQTLPRAVKLGVDRAAADRYAEALRTIGGRVEVRAARPAVSPPASPTAQAVVSPPGPTRGRPTGSTRPAPPGLVKEHSRSTVPYASATFALPGMMRAGLGAVIVGLGVTFRGNAFAGHGDLLDLLLAWVGAVLCTAGLAEGTYGWLRHRRVRLRLPAALLWIAILSGLQYLHGNALGPE
jgi:hypothetical protein